MKTENLNNFLINKSIEELNSIKNRYYILLKYYDSEEYLDPVKDKKLIDSRNWANIDSLNKIKNLDN